MSDQQARADARGVSAYHARVAFRNMPQVTVFSEGVLMGRREDVLSELVKTWGASPAAAANALDKAITYGYLLHEGEMLLLITHTTEEPE